MRRGGVYDSDAVSRDDEDPFRPGEREDRDRSWVDWSNVSHALMPTRLRTWAIDVSVRTDRDTAAPGEEVGVRVELANRLPFPVVLRTRSPVRWFWAVDDVPSASHVADADPDGGPALLRFARRERKVFDRRWFGRFQETESRWSLAEAGDHEITAWINVGDATGRGLAASTTVRLEEP